MAHGGALPHARHVGRHDFVVLLLRGDLVKFNVLALHQIFVPGGVARAVGNGRVVHENVAASVFNTPKSGFVVKPFHSTNSALHL